MATNIYILIRVYIGIKHIETNSDIVKKIQIIYIYVYIYLYKANKGLWKIMDDSVEY